MQYSMLLTKSDCVVQDHVTYFKPSCKIHHRQEFYTADKKGKAQIFQQFKKKYLL